MGKELIRLNRRRSTKSLIDRIVERPGDALIVHYSCESFYDRNDGRTPRVTSIAVRNFDSGQTESFSIHKVAEVRGISLGEIAAQYDELEKPLSANMTETPATFGITVGRWR